MLTGHEILRLQFLTGARREAHAEMRQPLKPRARDAHLLGTVLGGKFSDGVEIFGGTFRAEEFRGCVKRLAGFLADFDPEFADPLVLPVRDKADAIRT